MTTERFAAGLSVLLGPRTDSPVRPVQHSGRFRVALSNFTHAYALQAHQRDLLLAILFKVGSRGSAAGQRVGIVNDKTRLHTHTRGRLGGD